MALAFFGETGHPSCWRQVLFAFGMGTGPADHLLCQKSSRCSMNVTSVLPNLCAGTANSDRLNSCEDAVQAH